MTTLQVKPNIMSYYNIIMSKLSLWLSYIAKDNETFCLRPLTDLNSNRKLLNVNLKLHKQTLAQINPGSFRVPQIENPFRVLVVVSRIKDVTYTYILMFPVFVINDNLIIVFTLV